MSDGGIARAEKVNVHVTVIQSFIQTFSETGLLFQTYGEIARAEKVSVHVAVIQSSVQTVSETFSLFQTYSEIE